MPVKYEECFLFLHLRNLRFTNFPHVDRYADSFYVKSIEELRAIVAVFASNCPMPHTGVEVCG